MDSSIFSQRLMELRIKYRYRENYIENKLGYYRNILSDYEKGKRDRLWMI